MLEAFTISSDSRFHTLMIVTEKKSARAFTLEIDTIIKFKRIYSNYFDIANSEKVVLSISAKWCSICNTSASSKRSFSDLSKRSSYDRLDTDLIRCVSPPHRFNVINKVYSQVENILQFWLSLSYSTP